MELESSHRDTKMQCRRHGFNPWVRKILWKRPWQLTPVFLLRESHGQRILAGYSLLGPKKLDTTEVTEHACIQGPERRGI